MDNICQNSVEDQQNKVQQPQRDQIEYTNLCFDMISGLQENIRMLKICKKFGNTCSCMNQIYMYLSEIGEIGKKYQGDHLINSLICLYIELQGHQPKEDGVERDLTDEELNACPLEIETMERYLEQQCQKCNEHISNVIMHPPQTHENLKSNQYWGLNQCLANIDLSQFQQEFSKFCQKKKMFGVTFCLMDELEADPNNKQEMELYQFKKFTDSVFIIK